MSARSALGRGLGSLIPSAAPKKPAPKSDAAPAPSKSAPAKDGERVIQVSPADIIENAHQPRHHFAEKELDDLAASIKEHGIMQPLVVTRAGDKFELIAGERRLRASRRLGLETVPAIVRTATEQQKLELALIENIQRQDLNPVEEAVAYQALIDQFGLTQEEVGKRVGKSRPAVGNALRLLELPEEMLGALREGKITKSHARTLLSENDPGKRRALFKAMLSGDMSVHEAEERVSGSRRSPGRSRKDPNIAAHERALREALGTRVSITERGGSGKIAIHFYAKEELLDLLKRLSSL